MIDAYKMFLLEQLINIKIIIGFTKTNFDRNALLAKTEIEVLSFWQKRQMMESRTKYLTETIV